MLLLKFLFLLALNETHAANIDQHFQSYFYSAQIDGRTCGKNVDGFISLLKRQNDLPSDLRRIVIRAPRSRWHMSDMLIALQSRFGSKIDDIHSSNFWYFHVIATSNNKVYDFSFGAEPRVLTRKEYLNEMFIPKKPVLIFGRSFRIAGKGPYYSAQDGMEELRDYQFEVFKINPNGEAVLEKTYETANEFLDAKL